MTHTIQPSEPLGDRLDYLISTYPSYYRAWKSMISTYGRSSVTLQWRGTAGLEQFIADSSTLDNNPTVLPDVSVKIKRIEPAFMFSPDNIYWYIPRVEAKRLAGTMKAAGTITGTITGRMHAPLVLPSVLPSVLTPITGITVESIKQSYPSIESKETRLDTLFTESMTRTLSSIELAELDILGKLVVSPDGTLPTPVPKCEDI